MFTMRYLSVDGMPAPMLKDAEVEDPLPLFERICREIAKLYENYLVHGDLSKFNVLVCDGRPYLIDFPQALDFSSRLVRKRQLKTAQELLLRDLVNVADYFKNKGIKVDSDAVFRGISGTLHDDWLEMQWRQPWRSFEPENGHTVKR